MPNGESNRCDEWRVTFGKKYESLLQLGFPFVIRHSEWCRRAVAARHTLPCWTLVTRHSPLRRYLSRMTMNSEPKPTELLTLTLP
ncbi:MAG: hypothetical protein QOF48_2825, partial [Verrucomicrobiota bacterium]